MANGKKEFPADVILAEYDPVGKYRVRALEGKEGPVLDVREYVVAQEAGAFEGFTRKGIRIDQTEAKRLAAALVEFLKR